MFVAVGAILTQADIVKLSPRLTVPASKYCEDPLKRQARPTIPPLEEVGATPVRAGCCCALSAKGKPLAFKCQTSRCSGVQTMPLVVEGGGLVARGLPQEAQRESFA